MNFRTLQQPPETKKNILLYKQTNALSISSFVHLIEMITYIQVFI